MSYLIIDNVLGWKQSSRTTFITTVYNDEMLERRISNISIMTANSWESSTVAGIHDSLLAPGRASTVDEGEYSILGPGIFDGLAL